MFRSLHIDPHQEERTIMPGRRNRGGRGGRGRGNRLTARAAITASLIPHPADMPQIREQLVAQRWVRTLVTFSEAKTKQITLGDIIPNMFSGANAGRGSFFVHRLRFWGPELTSDASGTTPARLRVPDVQINIPLRPLSSTGSDFPFQRFTDQGMTGSTRSCVAVLMPRFWQEFPLSVNDQLTVLLEVINPVVGPSYHLDVFVTLSYAPELAAYEVVL